MRKDTKIERNAEIVRLYEDEDDPKSVTELSEQFDVSHQRISQILEKAGVERRAPANFHHIHMEDEILELVTQPGATMASVADELGISRATVSRVCNRHNVITGAERERMERDEEIVRLYTQGDLTQQEIGDMFGLSQPSVSSILQNNNAAILEFSDV